jgi:ABC-type spermidine/putrescine transport system permease subunit II
VSQLTRSIQDRLFVGLLGAVFAPACGYALFFVPVRPWHEETDWVYRLLALLRIEALSVVFSISMFGLIWAIWTPDWIEHRLKKAFRRFLLLVFITSVIVTAICFYMLFIGV